MSIGDLVKWIRPLNEKCYSLGYISAIRFGDGVMMLHLEAWTQWIRADECEVVR